MKKDLLEKAISQGVCDCDLHLSQIPDIDLYIDQILTLVAAKHADASPRYRENVLTKTMINNYSKEGLLMPVKGKKYTKEHIVQMLLIYSLKNSISIGDIHRMLDGARGEGVVGAELMKSYERHLEDKEHVRTLAADSVKAVYGNAVKSGRGSDHLVALLDLLSYSAYLRNVALELLEARYPSVPDDNDNEKKKEKDKDNDDDNNKKPEKPKKSEKEKKDKDKKDKDKKNVEKITPDNLPEGEDAQ